MANDITTNRWVIDTVGTIYSTWCKILRIEYHPNAADNDLVITDINGDNIWTVRAIASSANHEASGIEQREFAAEGKMCNGIVVSTLDGGVVYIDVA